MNRVVVVGDGIQDHYYFGRSLRLCQEAPVPIVRWEKAPEIRQGGAFLVVNQLRELLGAENVIESFGSLSHKHRYYADGVLQLRADNDSVQKPTDYYENQVELLISLPTVKFVVVSDYGKGAISKTLAEKIVAGGKPVFVDAKNTWDWYKGAFCAFPNRYEGRSDGNLESRGIFGHVIRKNAQYGCAIDGEPVRTGRNDEVRDPTGAGDVFLAAFVGAYLKTENLKVAAKFANMVAGISVKHIGTHVVRRSELPEPPAALPVSTVELSKTETPKLAVDHSSSDAIAAGGE